MEGQKSIFVNVLSSIVVIFTFGIVLLLFFKAPPPENKENLNMAIGFLIGTGMAGVIGYYFGSSQGSERKTKVIENLTTPPVDGANKKIDGVDVKD